MCASARSDVHVERAPSLEASAPMFATAHKRGRRTARVPAQTSTCSSYTRASQMVACCGRQVEDFPRL